LKILVDADAWQFWEKAKFIFPPSEKSFLELENKVKAANFFYSFNEMLNCIAKKITRQKYLIYIFSKLIHKTQSYFILKKHAIKRSYSD